MIRHKKYVFNFPEHRYKRELTPNNYIFCMESLETHFFHVSYIVLLSHLKCCISYISRDYNLETCLLLGGEGNRSVFISCLDSTQGLP